MRADEHHQYLAIIRQRLAGGIGSRQVKAQAAEFAPLTIENHRHVGRIRAAGYFCYQGGENVRADKFVGDGNVVS